MKSFRLENTSKIIESSTAKSKTKTCPWVPLLHIFKIPPEMVIPALPWKRVNVSSLVPHLSADAGSLSNKNPRLQNTLWRKLLRVMSSKSEPIFFQTLGSLPTQSQHGSFSPWLYLSWPILLQAKVVALVHFLLQDAIPDTFPKSSWLLCPVELLMHQGG